MHWKLFIVLNLLTISLLAQGPLDGWMKGKNNTDIALSFNRETYDTYRFGNVDSSQNNLIQSASIFIEHGFSDSLDLVFTVPFMRTPICDGCAEFNQGFQDGTLHLKFRSSKKKKEKGYLKKFAAVGVSTPIGQYSDTLVRPLGARNTVLQGRYFLQQDFFSGMFLHFQTGVDFRFIPNSLVSVPLILKTGYGGKRLFLEGFLEYLHTINSTADLQISGGGGSTWLKSGATIYYAIKPNFGVYLKGAWILGGENIGLSSTYGFGAAYRLKWK